MKQIDTFTLAAFMEGTLSQDERKAVIKELARNAELREVLQMAQACMEAARAYQTQPDARSQNAA